MGGLGQQLSGGMIDKFRILHEVLSLREMPTTGFLLVSLKGRMESKKIRIESHTYIKKPNTPLTDSNLLLTLLSLSIPVRVTKPAQLGVGGSF
jgi:hypothetical protein